MLDNLVNLILITLRTEWQNSAPKLSNGVPECTFNRLSACYDCRASFDETDICKYRHWPHAQQCNYCSISTIACSCLSRNFLSPGGKIDAFSNASTSCSEIPSVYVT